MDFESFDLLAEYLKLISGAFKDQVSTDCAAPSEIFRGIVMLYFSQNKYNYNKAMLEEIYRFFTGDFSTEFSNENFERINEQLLEEREKWKITISKYTDSQRD